MATQSDIAKCLGLKIRRVQTLIDEGVIPKADRGEYDIPTCVSAYVAYKTGRETELDLSKERALLAKSQREKLDLEIEIKRGTLVETAKAEEEWGKVVMAVRAKLLAMPSKLAPLVCPADPEPAKVTLEDAIHETLTELSNPTLEYDPGDHTNEFTAIPTTAEEDGEPVGGRGKATKRGVKRGARKVADKEG